MTASRQETVSDQQRPESRQGHIGSGAFAHRRARADGRRCLGIRGSRLANWLLPSDSFAERALWSGGCWRIRDQ
jgi:hypothetical protein